MGRRIEEKHELKESKVIANILLEFRGLGKSAKSEEWILETAWLLWSEVKKAGGSFSSFDDFLEYLKSEPDKGRSILLKALSAVRGRFSPNSFWTFVSGVRKILRTAGIDASWLKVKKGAPRPRRLPTKEDLRRLFEISGVRARAIFACLKDSGMNPSQLLKLKVGDVMTGLDKGEKFIAVRMVREKTQTPFITFFGPEAVKALRLYLDVRKNEGEEIKRDSPLFPAYKFARAVGKSVAVRDSVKLAGAANLLERLRKKAGLEEMTLYDFRRWFSTRLISSGCPQMYVEEMLGHVLPFNGAYFKPSEEELRKTYEKYYFDALALEEDGNGERLRRRLAELEKERDELLEKLKALELQTGAVMKFLKADKRFNRFLKEMEKKQEEIEQVF